MVGLGWTRWTRWTRWTGWTRTGGVSELSKGNGEDNPEHRLEGYHLLVIVLPGTSYFLSCFYPLFSRILMIISGTITRYVDLLEAARCFFRRIIVTLCGMSTRFKWRVFVVGTLVEVVSEKHWIISAVAGHGGE